MKQEESKTFQIMKKKRFNHLVKLANTLDKKEEYKQSDHDKLDYFGIRELEKLFDDTDNNVYYKPVLVKSSFKKIISNMKEEEMKTKNYQ